MNPVMRTMQHQQHQHQQQRMAAAQKKQAHKNAKAGRRPPPPNRSRLMTSPASTSEVRTVFAANCDEKLTHLSGLFPDIDSPVIMDILQQKGGNIEAATRDLFQLTNPVSIDQTPVPSVPGIDSFELPPCYDDLDAEMYFSEKTSVDVNSSLPMFQKQKVREKPVLQQHSRHGELKRFNTSIGVMPLAPQRKDYLVKWQKGKTNWLEVNGRNVLIGPLPDDFLRVKLALQGRSQSLPDTSAVSPIYRAPPPISAGPGDEISRAREGRISPFRLPLKMEELDVPIDPDETENQLFEDHKLAHYLQNVEFLQRVRNNQQLYNEVTQAANSDSSQLHSRGSLNNMDKATKKKLTKIAKKMSKSNLQQL